MNLHTKHEQISWAQFETCNQEHRITFEKMCRSLFNHYFFDNKALLHSNPNNPGIEVEPILEIQTNKRISFQAKYFSSIDYGQIKHSAEQAVKHYSGHLDILYLYCNKDLTKTSKSYKDIEAILNAGNINLVPINNLTILEQVIENPVIASLYFNHHVLTKAWFDECLKTSLDSLGPRYNTQFNIDTKIEEYVDLFSKNRESVERINQKKSVAIKEIKENSWRCHGKGALIENICSAIHSLNDVTSVNVFQCLDWTNIIKEKFSDEIAELNNEIETKATLVSSSMGKNDSYIEIDRELRGLKFLVDFPVLLEFSDTEKKLIKRKVLIVQGGAGVGKSQLFANVAEKMLEANGCAVLLLGNSYLSDDSIMCQIPLHLGLNFPIDEFFNILEGIGEQNNQGVVIFIDAINESGNKNIWKTDLIKLFNKLDKLDYVRIAISVRTGFEKLVFDEACQQKIHCGEIIRLFHTGFQEESVEATKTFLNYYNIPFSPSYFLQHEMTNPLFLTLFCKTYSGGEFDIFTLFEKIIERTDEEVQKAVGLDGTTSILRYLIYEIAEFQLNHGKKAISKIELFELGFWCTFGLIDKKIQFISALEKAGLLISSVYRDTETFFLGYNLLEDFVCAKFIMRKNLDKESLIYYLRHELLKIENGKIENYSNVDIFVVVCSLYAEKYKEECIDIIYNLNNEFDKQSIIDSYVDSFLWRKTSTVNSDGFVEFINSHKISVDKVWQVFIENSIKSNHPLNAKFLHSVLLNKSISQRDYIWTKYINDLGYEEERIYQLIDFFDKGNSMDGLNDENIKLLLNLFSWLLTSSNRFLRDKTSKAMIELLKNNFQFCKNLLCTFETINDPFVIQRLYGVVFGACMKRTQKYTTEFKELSEYIYHGIFNKDFIYPDILLRDYARLIIERWLYEFPSNREIINVMKIKPPYQSEEIPIVKKEEYYQLNKKNSGFNSIASSMRPDHIKSIGMYGDFGRYVFQASLTEFEKIDMENLYHYAMQFIRDQLGYDDELFGSYDISINYNYNRHQTRKIERIGKKYQWIAMYNILARISDRHLIKSWSDEPRQFEGAWDPYVRDFDPTLNCNFLVPSVLPKFDFFKNESDEFYTSTTYNEFKIREWVKTTCSFLDSHASKLMIKDDSNQTWVLLNQYEAIKNKQNKLDENSMEMSNGSQEIWVMSFGYIVRENEFEIFKKELEKKNFLGRWFPESKSTYQLFNREYVWSPGYQSFFSDVWIDYEEETGEKIIKKHSGKLPKVVSKKNIEGDEIDEIILFEEQEWEQVEIVKKQIGQVMPTSSRILWEEQYDASQEDATAFDIPCQDILDFLQLEQKESDGCFYSKDGTLVSFDGDLAKICDGLLIRKDYLDKYLCENGMRLFWTCLGEKQYFLGNLNQIYGEWSGFFYLEGDVITGNMEYKNKPRLE